LAQYGAVDVYFDLLFPIIRFISPLLSHFMTRFKKFEIEVIKPEIFIVRVIFIGVFNRW